MMPVAGTRLKCRPTALHPTPSRAGLFSRDRGQEPSGHRDELARSVDMNPVPGFFNGVERGAREKIVDECEIGFHQVV